MYFLFKSISVTIRKLNNKIIFEFFFHLREIYCMIIFLYEVQMDLKIMLIFILCRRI